MNVILLIFLMVVVMKILTLYRGIAVPKSKAKAVVNDINKRGRRIYLINQI